MIAARQSYIGGGTDNCIKSTHASVIGGRNNFIESMFSFIGAGFANTVSGTYSAILGGSGNVVGANYSYAGIFGQGINAVASNTFHVECLNAVNTPGPFTSVPGALPVGTIYYGTGVIAGACPLYIR